MLAIWRGRLNIFWLTFVTEAQAPPATAHESARIGSLPFDTICRAASPGGNAQTQIQIQLHWSEYVQGKWSNRISTDLNKFRR